MIKKSLIAGLALLAAVSAVRAEEQKPWAIWPDDHVFDDKIGTVQPITVGCRTMKAAMIDGKRWIEDPTNWDTKYNSAACVDLTKVFKTPVPMLIVDVYPSGLNKEATHHLFIVKVVDAAKHVWFTWGFENVKLPLV